VQAISVIRWIGCVDIILVRVIHKYSFLFLSLTLKVLRTDIEEMKLCSLALDVAPLTGKIIAPKIAPKIVSIFLRKLATKWYVTLGLVNCQKSNFKFRIYINE